MRIRQPIVSVLGHVDHGKTTLLDRIRGTTVVQREAGRITQHIGATEVPVDVIYRICGDLLKEKSLKVPGLLFIDTPGHEAFTTLRARGGSLADLAVLVVDIYEGLKPQSIESLNYLKQYKTPFIVAANKIDRLSGWVKDENVPFVINWKRQTERYQKDLEERIYDLIGALAEHGFSAERFDRVVDFTTTLAIVPMSAKWGVGLQELLMLLVGLSQRFLEKRLEVQEGEAKGTVLEVKEEKGLGKTLDVIIYDGVLRVGDTIVVGTTSEPLVSKVKSLLKPKPLDEIRDPQHRFDHIDEVVAAAGVKVLAREVEGALAGAP
ncbi:MAG: translation initiation factor IF-2, partial [Thermoplasmata archaeon]|nr:translation initiation factor IF-2 [Thermoplasmata archaeon]